MRILITSAALGLALPGLALPVAAQGIATTRTPPAPHSSARMPQPANSLPNGAATSTRSRPGTAIDRDTTAPDTQSRSAAPASRP